MKHPANNWYVITGAPSSGKSTIIKELTKLGYKTTEEMGRKLIEQELAKGKTLDQVNVDSKEFEEAWVDMQQQKEAILEKSELIFFDRGVLDTLGYFRFYKWPLTDNIKKWCAAASYKKVFLLEMLDYEDDGVRVESAKTARKMQDLFRQGYEEAGYEVIIVPRDTVKNRLALILKHIDQP